MIGGPTSRNAKQMKKRENEEEAETDSCRTGADGG